MKIKFLLFFVLLIVSGVVNGMENKVTPRDFNLFPVYYKYAFKIGDLKKLREYKNNLKKSIDFYENILKKYETFFDKIELQYKLDICKKKYKFLKLFFKNYCFLNKGTPFLDDIIDYIIKCDDEECIQECLQSFKQMEDLKCL